MERLGQNALLPNESLGWITITHPYHPFRGQRFPIIKIRHRFNQETFILQGSELGTFTVPREWTDRALPSLSHPSDSPLRLDVSSLLLLQKDLQRLKEKDSFNIDKHSQKS